MTVIEQPVVPKIVVKTMRLRLVGITPLIVHKWSMRSGETKERLKARRDLEATPAGAFEAARYRQHFDGYEPYLIDAFPTFTIKASVLRASLFVEGVTIRNVRMNMHVMKDVWLTPLERASGKPYYGELGSKHAPTCREDAMRRAHGPAFMRYRPEYPQWEIPIDVTYNAAAITADELMALFVAAGKIIGIGQNTPERCGIYGTFDVRETV